MLPTDYDLRLVRQRCLDLRAEADTYRRIQAAHQASTADLSIVVRLVRFVLVATPARQLTATQQAAA
jgi:hypothetical protein